MIDSMLGEIKMFAGNYAPWGWAFCDGQLLAVNNHSALFALIGNKFGGDGQHTFALPDLRGCAPVHQGCGEGLNPRKQGQRDGNETVPVPGGAEVDIKMTPEHSINFIISLEGIWPEHP